MATNDENPAMQHLIQARAAALANPSLYQQVMPPILGLVSDSDNPSLALKRWVADFIAEALATPVLASEEKQTMALTVLTIIMSFLESQEQDAQLLKSAIQASASAYPLVFRHIISHPQDKEIWQQLVAIKHHILRHMDSYSPGVRICCIKYVQKVVQTQSMGVISDPRRPERNEISLALVPRGHPLIPPADVEAETHGLLDRILDTLTDKTSNFLILTATINSLGALVKSRVTVAPRIINAVMQYDPTIMTPRPITTRVKIEMRSMERTIRALFKSIIARQETHPLRERMEMFMHRLAQARVAIVEEARKKRPAPSDLAELADSTKRQKVDVSPVVVPITSAASAPVAVLIPPPPLPTTVSQLFTLSDDPNVQPFDVNLIPVDIVQKIIVPVLRDIDPSRLVAAVNAVKLRYGALMQARAQSAAVTASTIIPASVVEEDDDYEPDFEPVEDVEQIKNRLEMKSSDELGIGPAKDAHVTLGSFRLPLPEQLSKEDLDKLNYSTMDRIFGLIDEYAGVVSKATTGFNRLAASANDRQSMITNFIRLITRPIAGVSEVLAKEINGTASTGGIPASTLQAMKLKSIGDRGRQQLLHYILNDWTHRMDIATTWLTEEWYNDLWCSQSSKQEGDALKRNFSIWAHRFLDELAVYISHEHTNLLIRFVSEVPGLDADLLNKIKRLALDPERIVMTVKAFHYLVMFRPPIRDLCLDSVEDMWLSYEGAKTSCTPILKKFRPQVLDAVVPEAAA